ncbi:MAG: PBP1A family penicillin-binding protein [Desulfuromonadales bacterium]
MLKIFLYRPVVFVIVLLTLVSSAGAQETTATYPLLPAGYTSIKVFDNQGRFVGRILPEKRYWVPIDRIPPFLQKAVVSVEDARFFEHGGIDFRGIARALVKDVVKGRLAEGGSTITQQLIKNRHLSGEKTIERKLEEARMALEYEKKYSKKQILEMYFNEIYYGNGAWGLAQAARLYFDKNPEELTDAECAMLAGVQKNPARYNPLGKPENVTGRRDLVLKRMEELEVITPRQKEMLRAKPPAVTRPGQASHYLSHIRGKLIERYGTDIIEQGGLEVTTALDLNLQNHAELVLREGLKKFSPELQGALICLDAATGDLLAAVGGVDSASKSSFNRAFSARRQPGSAIKPLIYAAALENGITAGSIWSDSPVSYDNGGNGTWQPQNYDRKSHGDLSLRQALAHSNNVIAVKLLEAVGVPRFVDYVGRLGLQLRAESGLSLALGTGEVTPLELTQAYTPLAASGIRAEARAILRIYDRNRKTWVENPTVLTPAISPDAAFITTQMLKDVMVYGTAKGLKSFSQSYPSAGKTGTTDDYRDAWFVGYTPQLVTAVWAGYDKPRPGGKGFTGGAVAAPVWDRFMRKAVTVRPSADFIRPETVVSVSIDPASGLLASDDCPDRFEEFFIAGSEPEEYCSRHSGADILPDSN